MRLGQRADMRKIDDIERRVGGRLEEENLGVGLDRRFPRGIVGAVDHGGFDAEARQQAVDQPAARPERRARRHAMVARRKLAQQSRRHRRHPAGLRAAGFGTFEQGDALFQHGDSGVLEARIGHAVRLAREPRRDGGGIVVGIAAGQEQRLAGFALLAAPGSTPHGLRRGAPVPGCRTVHAGGLFHGLQRWRDS